MTGTSLQSTALGATAADMPAVSPRRTCVTGRVSPEDLARIEAWAASGMRCGRIAQRLGRPYDAVYYHMLRLGLIAPGHARPVDYVRHGRPVLQFTLAEDRVVRRLRQGGLNPREIGEALGRLFPGRARRPHTVRHRLSWLACADAAIEDRAMVRGVPA